MPGGGGKEGGRKEEKATYLSIESGREGKGKGKGVALIGGREGGRTEIYISREKRKGGREEIYG